jgi:hypothetical protein
MPCGRWHGAQQLPQRAGSCGPFREHPAVDEVEPLLTGEVAPRLGDPAVGHHHHDVGLAHGSPGSVEHLQLRGAHGRAPVSVAVVLALDHPAPPERVGGLHVGTQIAPAADPLGS